MAWIKYLNPHVADNAAIETLTPKVALAFIRTGLIVGVLAGLVVGYSQRKDLEPKNAWVHEICEKHPEASFCH